MKIELKNNERIDDLEYKGLKIIQNKEWFCFGIDSVMLANFSRNEKKQSKILDLGTGTGIIAILLSQKIENSQITAIEIQKEVADMAERSVKLNDLEKSITIINDDIKNISRKLGQAKFDVVVTNPPYKKRESGIINKNDVKTISRHETTADLEDFIRVANEELKSQGTFYMINRPERIADIIEYLRKYKLEPKEIRFVQPKRDKAPNEVLIKAVKHGGRFLKVLEPLIIYNDDGTYTDEILKIYEKI